MAENIANRTGTNCPKRRSYKAIRYSSVEQDLEADHRQVRQRFHEHFALHREEAAHRVLHVVLEQDLREASGELADLDARFVPFAGGAAFGVARADGEVVSVVDDRP
jgi:hypothetical protein